MILRLLALLLVTLLVGCDQGVQSLADTATSVARISVRLTNDPAVYQAKDPSATTAETMHMRIGVLWLGLPSVDVQCLEAYQASLGVGEPLDASMTAVVAAGCGDVFATAPGQVGPSVPVVPNQVATIEFLDLPSSNSLVGLPGNRVAYAGLVLFDDRNKSGVLELQQVALPSSLTGTEQMGPGGGGGEGGGGGGGGPGSGMGGQVKPKKIDYIYGASFVSMIKPNTRLAYREGTWDLGKLFYPILGCAEPPIGFSWIDATGLPTKATCNYTTLPDRVVDLAAAPSETVTSVACRQRAATYLAPPKEWTPTTPWACVDKNHLVFANDPGPCKALTHIALKGCFNSATCKEPQWDMSEVPPKWWPCSNAAEPKTK